MDEMARWRSLQEKMREALENVACQDGIKKI